MVEGESNWAPPVVVPHRRDVFIGEEDEVYKSWSISTDALKYKIGPLVQGYLNVSDAYDQLHEENIIKRILYSEVVIPTDSEKYDCAARFIPGATMAGIVGPVKKYKVMIIGKMPSYDYIPLPKTDGDILNISPASPVQKLMGAGTEILLGAFKEVGLTYEEYKDFYVTNVIRFPRIDGGAKKTLPAAWSHECKHYLEQELYLVQPDVILCLGTEASKAITKIPVTKAQGRVFDIQITTEKSAKVICAYDPRTVLDKFEHRPMLLAGVALFTRVIRGERYSTNKTRNFHYVQSEIEAAAVVDTLIEAGITDFSIDCEWGGGQHYMDLGAKLRTIQVAWSGQDCMVIVLRRAGMREAFEPYPSSAIAQLRRLICRPEVRVIGHNLSADFGWLYEVGLDLSGQFYFDTMLASHLFEPTASHDLDSLAVRLLPGWERHDADLQEWKAQNKGLVTDDTAYGNIPDDILLPYGANDACATYLVYKHYDAKLLLPQYSMLNRLFRRLVMPATLAFIELERTGVYMDRDRLIQMESMYRDKYVELLTKFRDKIGRPRFNPNSSPQKVDLLYRELGLTPVKTTGKYPMMWDEVIDQRKTHLYTPAVDDETLGILATRSSVAKDLQDICLIATVRKSFLTPKVITKSGVMEYKKGLIGFIKRDGRLHSQISQMVKTGRLASHDPNLMNMPNQQEAAIQEAGGGSIYKIRSAFMAEPGYLIVSSDYKQAEVATLAYLSGDQMLINAIETGQDIHSSVAVQMFKLPCAVYEVKEQYKALRVAAKSLVFGIIYGRGRKAVCREIEKAGVPCTEDEAQNFIDTFMDQFPRVKLFIDRTQDEVETRMMVETLWGRREPFYKVEGDRGDIIATQKRQSVNFKIQSYCADLLRLALINLRQYRRDRGMKFKLILTVHDSIMLEVPMDEVVNVADMAFPMCMTTEARSPVGGFTVGCDVDVYKRWDEALYLEEMLDMGLPEEFSSRFCVADKEGNPVTRVV